MNNKYSYSLLKEIKLNLDSIDTTNTTDSTTLTNLGVTTASSNTYLSNIDTDTTTLITRVQTSNTHLNNIIEGQGTIYNQQLAIETDIEANTTLLTSIDTQTPDYNNKTPKIIFLTDTSDSIDLHSNYSAATEVVDYAPTGDCWVNEITVACGATGYTNISSDTYQDFFNNKLNTVDLDMGIYNSGITSTTRLINVDWVRGNLGLQASGFSAQLVTGNSWNYSKQIKTLKEPFYVDGGAGETFGVTLKGDFSSARWAHISIEVLE